MPEGRLQLEALVEEWAARRVGRRIEIHDTVDGTNRLAWARVLHSFQGWGTERQPARPEGRGSEGQTPCDGLVIFAEYQTAGRGRLGRRWYSPRGASVMMSLVLHEPPGRLGGEALALLTVVAAVDAIRAATGVWAEIKWPNDLVVNGRKLGGILIESRPADVPGNHPVCLTESVFVVGIGINCLQHGNHFPPECRESATSLDLESPRPVDRTLVARHLLFELDRWLAEPESWDGRTLQEEWIRRALPLGGRVHLRQGGIEYSGQVLDVDPAAGLVVQLDDGGRRLFAAANTSMLPDASDHP